MIFTNRREIVEFFRGHGVSPTDQRVEMAYSITRKPDHFKAEDVTHKVNKKLEIVSRATIYNNLSLFVEIGILQMITINPALTFYDSNTQDHFHYFDPLKNTLTDIPIQENLAHTIRSHILANVENKMPIRKTSLPLNVVLHG